MLALPDRPSAALRAPPAEDDAPPGPQNSERESGVEMEIVPHAVFGVGEPAKRAAELDES